MDLSPSATGYVVTALINAVATLKDGDSALRGNAGLLAKMANAVPATEAPPMREASEWIIHVLAEGLGAVPPE